MERMELDLKDIFLILRRRCLAIVAITVLCGLGAWLVTSFLITPLYSASVSMYVSSDPSRENTNSVTTSKLSASAQLVDTYIVVLESNSVLQEVINLLQLPYEPDVLRSKMQASSINGTEAFSITITVPDPEMAQLIVNTIAEVSPSEIIRVVKVGSVEVIDWATLPTQPSSPSVVRNVLLGVLLGLVVSCFVFILIEILDTTIRREEDITKGLGVPLLGVVPKLVEVNSTKEEASAT